MDLPHFHILRDDLLVPRMLSVFQCGSPCRVISNNRVHKLTLGLNQDLLALNTWCTDLLSVFVLKEV